MKKCAKLSGFTVFGSIDVNTLKVNSIKCEELYSLLRENKLDSIYGENREKNEVFE